MDFESFIQKCKPVERKRIAVAAAEDDNVLKAVREAYDSGLGVSILCGDPVKIEAVARQFAVDISPFEIVPAASQKEAAQAAVALVREGRADILMKGLLQTADLLRAVLDKESGIRGKGVLSHVGLLQSPFLNRTFFLTDAAMCIAPDLKTKVELVRNAIIVARGLGVDKPKVAPLAAVEVVNPDMPATLDAAALTLMCHRGQIKDCVIDGPLALDLALSEDAARHKGVESAVAGKADILLCHTIETANSTLKGFILGGNCLFGGLVMGATAPIVMTSRSDSDQSKLCSIACAAALNR